MAIQPGDWPIDPYAVGGVDLAAILNRIFPDGVVIVNTPPGGAAIIPPGGNALRPASPSPGWFRFNTDLNAFEGYANGAWGAVGGGASGGGNDRVFFENDQTVTTSKTLTAGRNSGTFGPLAIANGATVTVPDGVTWSIV